MYDNRVIKQCSLTDDVRRHVTSHAWPLNEESLFVDVMLNCDGGSGGFVCHTISGDMLESYLPDSRQGNYIDM